MKNLGKIESGGSLDITTNRHVEDLVAEALKGIEIPEGADTTYTLTQDGLTVQLVDSDGAIVSEIELPNLEDTNTTYTITRDGTTIRLVDDLGQAVSTIDLPAHEDENTTYTLIQDGSAVQLIDDGGRAVSTINLPEHEDTNTTYTLTQDGTIIKLVDSGGSIASEIDLTPLLPEDGGGGDPYQEEKEFTLPPVNLFTMLRDEYDDFEITSEFNTRTNRISVYLRLYRNGIVRTFTLVSNSRNLFPLYRENGDIRVNINLEEVSKRRGSNSFNVVGTLDDGSIFTNSLAGARIQPRVDSELNSSLAGVVLYGWDSSWGFNANHYLLFRSVNSDRSETDPLVITGTLEEHLQLIYENFHHLYN